jgi:hypothetical protein
MVAIQLKTTRNFTLARFYMGVCTRLLGVRKFEGIHEIALVDDLVLGPSSNVHYRYENTRGNRTLGFYFFENHAHPPRIEISAQAIYQGIPFPFRLTPIMILRLGRVLAHELVHHRIRCDKIQVEDLQEEKLADKFAQYFETKLCHHFWYRFWRWLLRDIARWHFAFGAADHRLGNFERAEQNYYTAWALDHRHLDAAKWFWTLHHFNRNVQKS